MRPDAVCREYADQGVGLTVRELDCGYVLLEGDPNSLKFLADLILAVCDPEDDGFQLSPDGAGSVFFTEEATLGLYLHCLPCPSAP